ncbi:MAG: glucokinase [Candidatus Electrothrix sp. YB6]
MKQQKPAPVILAGDIGATKTALALYDITDIAGDSAGSLLLKKTFRNTEFRAFQEVISAFLAGQERLPKRACFGVAGPVRANRVQMTNLHWTVDGDEFAGQFGMDRVLLVNDLVATAAGAVQLADDGLIPLNQGQRKPDGSIGVLAAGTGLGQAFAMPVNNRLQPFPTEGGHASFAPRNQEQMELLQFMLARQKEQATEQAPHLTPHVSVEQVCSGMALPDLYAFMLTRCSEPEWMQKTRLQTEPDDLAPLIVRTANTALHESPSCEPAVRAVQLLVDILAAEAANLALKVLATGGIFLGGGMVTRLLPFFTPERFMAIFCRGIYRQMLADIPVHIIVEPDTALLGARQLAC